MYTKINTEVSVTEIAKFLNQDYNGKNFNIINA